VKTLFWAMAVLAILAGASTSFGVGPDGSAGQSQSGSVVRIDGDDRITLNGKPFFPLGLFVVQCTNGQYAQELDEIAKSPFDTVMNYAVNRCGTDATDGQILSYLDELEKRNLRLIFSLKDFVGHEQKDLEVITHKIKTFKNHSGLLAWYMNDERGPEHLPEVGASYKLAKELDRNHPVWSVHWNTDWLLQQAHTTDVVGVDPYPIGNHAITLVSIMADAALQTGKPLWLVPQIFDWRDYPGDFRAKTGRPPTRDEIRAMTYLAINHGAKGLIYYSYFNLRDDKDYEPRWGQLKEIGREVRQLATVLFSSDESADLVRCNTKDIDFATFRLGRQSYLTCVNTKEILNAKVEIQISGIESGREIRVLFENGRKVLSRVGSFTDSFGPFGVHVYCWKSLDRIDPRANLGHRGGVSEKRPLSSVKAFLALVRDFQ
jgi:hypothetical protein